MKHLKYLFLALSFVLIGACGGSKDEPNSKKEEVKQKVKFEIKNNVLVSATVLEPNTHIDIPEGVEEVADYVFNFNKNVTSVNIPSSVKRIGKEAFANSGLQSITLPKNVKYVGKGAFARIEMLESVNISTGIKEIYDNCFSHCKHLKKITLPNTLTTIGENAFLGCERLEKIELPKSLRKIKFAAFSSSGLREIHLPVDLEHIEVSAFSFCDNLKTLSFWDKLKWERGALDFSKNIEHIYAYVEEPPTKKWNFLNSFFGTLHVPKYSLEKYKEKFQNVNFKIEAIK